MKNQIDKLLIGEETLSWIEYKENCYFFISRRKGQLPFLIRGYDAGRNEIYDRFVACDDFNGAKETLLHALKVFDIKSKFGFDYSGI